MARIPLSVKIIGALFCAVALATPLAACGQQEESTVSYNAHGRRFTVPVQYFSGSTSTEARHLLEELQATDIQQNEDGSFTVTMSDEAYEAFVADNLQTTRSAIEAIPNSKSYGNLTRVTMSDDLTHIEFTTPRQDAGNQGQEAASWAIYLACLHQTIAGESQLRCTVEIVDPNNKVLKTYSYPTTD